jgi:hypothetical protein
MLCRLFSLRAAWWSVLGAALLLISAIAVRTGEDRVRLDADVLARSRGALAKAGLTQSQCNLFDGDFPCTLQGDACTTCTQQTFTDLQMVRNGGMGGYTTGGPGSCGSRMSGFCDAALNCTQMLTRTGICNVPPVVVVQ